MLVNPAEHDESAVLSCWQDNQVEQTERRGLFRGRQMAVAQNARLDLAGPPSVPQRTSGRNKRKISTSHDANALQDRAPVQFKERLRVLLDESFNHSLNSDFSRLIHEDRDTNQILIRLANADGVFNRGFSVKAAKSLSYGEQHDPNLLFVPCHREDGAYVLAVYEEDSNSAGGPEVQWLTRDDLFLHQSPHHQRQDYPQANCLSRLTLSGDSASLVCLDNERGGAIIGRTADGEWVNKGNCMRYDQLLFSADSNHVAMTYNDRLCLMSKGLDGAWTETGGIEFGFGRWEMAFSPDNQHFITWSQATGEHGNECPEYARQEFFVTLFALDDHQQWAEKKRIAKTAQQPTDRFTLQARFSPDGKHLLVCAADEFDIWTLGDDGHWSPTMEKNPYICGDTIKGIAGGSIHFTNDPGVFMLLGKNNGAVWGLDGSWSCQHGFFIDWSMHPQISPDGKAIVCKRAFDKNGLWLRQSSGLWDWQRFDFDGEHPRFNHDGSLLVIKEATQGVLVFMGPDSEGCWSEKVRARFNDDLESFDFSRNGRSIQVQYVHDGRKVMLILDITNADQLAVVPKKIRHDRR